MPRDRSRSRERTKDSHRDRDRDDRDRSRGKDKDRRRHRDRSASPRRDRDDDKDRERDHKRSSKKHKEREASPSDDEDLIDLEEIGVKEISEDDYFLKSNEFKYWLKEERGKYLDEMSSESAHKYFRKFVRRWNDGALPRNLYSLPATVLPASANTAYKWSFSGRADSSLAAVRADVGRMTHSGAAGAAGPSVGPSVGPSPGPSRVGPVGPSLPPSTSSAPRLGPSLPTASDRQYALETATDHARLSRKAEHKAAQARADELVPRGVGKEGKMEERRATNAENRAYREKDGAAGLEVDEGTLMGDSGGFAAALRQREAAEARRQSRKDIAQLDKRGADAERLQERRQKESATMDMFKAMARERFGGP
ncbi:hypothetical protein IAT38_001396 [Cryptococcus sp. DSM 104549]